MHSGSCVEAGLVEGRARPEISGLNKGNGHQRADTYKRHGGKSTDDSVIGKSGGGV